MAFTKGSTLIANVSKQGASNIGRFSRRSGVCGMVGCSKDQKVTINGDNSSN